MKLEQRMLGGQYVQLEPLGEEHRSALEVAAGDQRIWLNTPLGASFGLYFDTLLQARDAGRQLPFAVRWLANGQLIGGTRLMDLTPEHHRLEVGGTWYHPDYWGGATNPEAKLLLLEHAFEASDAYRVQFLTDELNIRSQAAIERLGAVREGVMRNHQVVDGGRRRNSVMYSIVVEEWATVKDGLQQRLQTFAV